MGTPQFAVPTLKALHTSKYKVSAVVTNPDRPKGRGRSMVASPVKQLASELKYPILQPEKMGDQWFVDRLQELAPDLIVVIAYGHILPKSLLQLPRYGAINVHASLLPKYRGAAPIQWSIINGETQTGVTTMWIDEGMDTGDILLQTNTDIKKQDTAQELGERLSELGAQLLIETLERIETGEVTRISQNGLGSFSSAPILKKADGEIDWAQNASALDSFVRGMNPWPGAFTTLINKRLKVWAAQAVDAVTSEEGQKLPAGTIVEATPDEFRVATGGTGDLILKEVQIESGKRMPGAIFLRGIRIPVGTVLG